MAWGLGYYLGSFNAYVWYFLILFLLKTFSILVSVWAHCGIKVETKGQCYTVGSFHPQCEFWHLNSGHRSCAEPCRQHPAFPEKKKNPSTWKRKTGGLLGVQSQLGFHIETVFLKNTPSTRCGGKSCNTWEVEAGGLGVWDQPLGMWNPSQKNKTAGPVKGLTGWRRLLYKPGNFSLIPGTKVKMAGENQVNKAALEPMQVYCGNMCVYARTYIHTEAKNHMIPWKISFLESRARFALDQRSCLCSLRVGSLGLHPSHPSHPVILSSTLGITCDQFQRVSVNRTVFISFFPSTSIYFM